jgi:mannose-6-phosphate isomerase-like protein (cupin superfamily)
MKKIGLLVVGLGLVGASALAQTAATPPAAPAGAGVAPDGLTVWPKGVPPAGAARANFEGVAMMISHRTAGDRVEVHQTVADIMVVQSGEATLVTGGEVVDPVQSGPNEMAGSGIKGGVSRTLVAGDVVEIPPGVPHQYFIAPGGQITYLLVKVPKK